MEGAGEAGEVEAAAAARRRCITCTGEAARCAAGEARGAGRREEGRLEKPYRMQGGGYIHD